MVLKSIDKNRNLVHFTFTSMTQQSDLHRDTRALNASQLTGKLTFREQLFDVFTLKNQN